MNNKQMGIAKPFGTGRGKIVLFLSLLFLFVAIIMFFLTNQQPPKLQVVSIESNDILLEKAIQPGDMFYHEYTHSVMKTPIREVFAINDDYEITAQETWTQSFGAGIPYEKNESIRKEDNFYVIEDDGRIVEEIRMIPSNLYPHRFHIHDQTIDMSELSENNRRVRIHVQGG